MMHQKRARTMIAMLWCAVVISYPAHCQPRNDPSTWIDWSQWKESSRRQSEGDEYYQRLEKEFKSTPMFKYGTGNIINERLKRLPDGTFEYNGDLEFCCGLKNDLTEFWNDCHISRVTGSFVIRGRNLTSLNGSPKTIGSYFDCSHNQLLTLENGPHKVGGSYNCSYNALTSLRGAPDTIWSNINCSHNEITSMSGGVVYVKGVLNISHNLLYSLDGMPQMGYCELCGDMNEYGGGDVEDDWDLQRRQRVRPKVILVPYEEKDFTQDMIPKHTPLSFPDTTYHRRTAFGCFNAVHNTVKFSDDEVWATGAYEWGYLYDPVYNKTQFGGYYTWSKKAVTKLSQQKSVNKRMKK